MSDREKYVLGGPRRRPARRRTIHTVDELLVDLFGEEPTRFVELPGGRLVVENPNVCGICHRPRHRDIPHHAFEADRAFPEIAASIGWPTPPPEVLL